MGVLSSKPMTICVDKIYGGPTVNGESLKVGDMVEVLDQFGLSDNKRARL